MAQTKEELEARIAALEGAGLDAEAEKTKLASLNVKGKLPPKAAPKAAAPAVKAPEAKAPEAEAETLDIPVDMESWNSQGGDWVSPTGGAGIYAGLLDDIIYLEKDDKVMFIVTSEPGADDEFRGVLQAGNVSKARSDKGAAWAVHKVASNLEIPFQELETGGIRILNKRKGLEVDVLYKDVKGRAIPLVQDIRLRGTLESAV